jgi:hypothetical protein
VEGDRQAIGVDFYGLVSPEENSRSPAKGSTRTFFDAGAAAYAIGVGHVFPPARIFTDRDTHRAIMAADTTLNAAAGIGRYLEQPRTVARKLWEFILSPEESFYC